MSGTPKVFLVEGASGQYEDYRTWPVWAFATQAEAEARKDALDAALTTFRTKMERVDAACFGGVGEPPTVGDDEWQRRKERVMAPVSKLDPLFVGDTDTSYSVVPVPFGVAR